MNAGYVESDQRVRDRWELMQKRAAAIAKQKEEAAQKAASINQ